MNEDFDLLILDLMLPGMDGFEICKRFREVKNTPIIMISAKKDDIDKIRGLGLGADDYMTKPFSPSEMVARVKAHLARYERLIGSGSPENEIIEIRGLKIDKTARRVWVNGEEKNLPPRSSISLNFSGPESKPCIHEGRTVPGNLGYGFHRRHCHSNCAYQKDS